MVAKFRVFVAGVNNVNPNKQSGRAEQNLAAPHQNFLVNNNNFHSTTFTMAKRQLYDTPHRSRVQGTHYFLVAEGIEHDERDILELSFVIQRSGYRMIEPSGPFTNLRQLRRFRDPRPNEKGDK